MAKKIPEVRRGERHRHDSVLEFLDDSGRVLGEVARLVDLSSVGVSFSTTRTFAKGERIRAGLRLLGVGVLTIIGRVVRIQARTNSTLYAVEFESVRGVRR